MSDVYTAPQADLETTETPNFTFATLGIWRKIFLAFNWLAILAMTVVLLTGSAALGEGASVGMGFSLVIILLGAGLTYWIHVAVCTRNVTQLLILAILQIIPFLNPIAALILFAIRSTSKKELGV